jgi:hypothetical protein
LLNDSRSDSLRNWKEKASRVFLASDGGSYGRRDAQPHPRRDQQDRRDLSMSPHLTAAEASSAAMEIQIPTGKPM